MRKFSAIVLLAQCLSGCAFSTHYRSPEAPADTPAVPAASVRLYSGEPAGRYQVIGSVAVDKMSGEEAVAEYLKEEAGALGANAVIQVRLTKINSIAPRTGASGTAVRLE